MTYPVNFRKDDTAFTVQAGIVVGNVGAVTAGGGLIQITAG